VCAADPRPAGARDGAIIALAYLSGGRKAELAGLHLADLDLDPPAIRVVGKGGKQRLVPLSPTAAPLIEAWLAWRGDQPGPLFCPIDRGDNLQHGLGRRSLAAGVKALSPHDLRRSYAGDLLDAGADLPAVQQLLGHASPATTSRYLNPRVLHRMHEKVQVGWSRR
jgi:integrase